MGCRLWGHTESDTTEATEQQQPVKGPSQVALVVKNLPASEGDTGNGGSIPGSGRSAGEGHGNPLQYSCLEHPHGQRSLVGYTL